MLKKVLHVGCSTLTLQHAPQYFQDGKWQEIRYDIDPSAKPDIIGTITDMHSVYSESMDAVYSAHNLEHVYTHEVDHVLNEFRRVLNKNGICVVSVPDLSQVAKLIIQEKLDEPAYNSPAGPITPLDMLYGLINSLKAGHHYMAHKTGFTPKSLGNAFLRAGFSRIEYFQYNYAVTVIAYINPPDQQIIDTHKIQIFGLK